MIKNETIVDRVVERLKAQPLGDLITEADLHEIVREAIPKAFFEKRVKVTNPGTYSERREELEPVIVATMRELLQASAAAAVKVWMADNADRIMAQWKEVVDAGLLNYVQRIQNENATLTVREALSGMLQHLNEERQKLGLPPVYF